MAGYEREMETLELYENECEAAKIGPEGSGPIRWLFVTAEFPWPLNHGTWLRVYHLTRSLRELGDEVAILSHEGEAAGRLQYTEKGVRVLSGLSGPVPHRGRSRCFLGPYVYDRELAEHLAESAGNFDVVVLVRPCMLQYSQEASSAKCVLLDMVDDPMLEEGRQLWKELQPRRLGCRIKFLAGEFFCERKYLDRIDLSLFVSGQDSKSFLRRNHSRRAIWVPNGVDIDYYSSPAEVSSVATEEPPVVSFVGNMIHPPNEEAAAYLLRELAPLIRQQEPRVRFCVIGSQPSDRLRKLAGPGMEVTGWVDDVRPWLWKSTVVILPMRTGTGIKNKLLEAWAAGKAVVASPLALQGVPARDGENLLVGTSSAELVEKTLQVIRDGELRRTLGGNGQETVRRCLTWSYVARNFRDAAIQTTYRKKVSGHQFTGIGFEKLSTDNR